MKKTLKLFFIQVIFSLRRDCQKLPMPTIFQVVMAGYWEKFSISNNRASDKPHWLRYCHCAKLENVSTHPLPPWLTTPFSLRVSDHQRVRGLGALPWRQLYLRPIHAGGGFLWLDRLLSNTVILEIRALSLGMLGNVMQISMTSQRRIGLRLVSTLRRKRHQEDRKREGKPKRNQELEVRVLGPEKKSTL